jgi:hypothetical protein
MNDIQKAKLKMYQNVLTVCSEYEEVYAKTPVFVSAVDELKQQVANIQSATQQQIVNNPKGVTIDKTFAIDRLVEISLKVANLIYVYAFSTGNNQLREKVNMNKSMFYRNHDQDSVALSKVIATEAKNNAETLLNYGLSENDITALDAAIVQAEELINAPSITIGTRKLHTSNLRRLFVAADSTIYDKLDKLIRIFKTSKPEFFILYTNARNVVNTSARKRKNTGENLAEEETKDE